MDDLSPTPCSDVYNQDRNLFLGSFWHVTTAALKAHAARISQEGARPALLAREDRLPRTNRISEKYAAYSTWDGARFFLPYFPGEEAAPVYELIAADEPCKPYLDIDRKEGANLLQPAIQRVFSNDYGI
mmetsp:Transcript_21326/g.59236  ORF Transcript_21326/g.59236 Transcript_21326/m.59236 type:complete len:129 (-) Transcript_21326:704-1090(-)|eukprot:CAMPEP_0117673188 /NCGR_PEP_ID=MMETSP0804-20121206/14335_1 /TAXON_ID=1074897 /ORGANISM="Tetraselmis astigmatica, Strain CCMP880" /LENGTH=128 /DNA_ID=CAMNT_0005481901 /DNA_START=73 /DNA_END=459 /DNA_ORIENTATION=-